MNNRESIVRRIDELESENLGHLATMAKSDAHAAKCSKLGVSFGEMYPDELAEYRNASETYNTNEAEIDRLKDELAAIPEEESPDYVPEEE